MAATALEGGKKWSEKVVGVSSREGFWKEGHCNLNRLPISSIVSVESIRFVVLSYFKIENSSVLKNGVNPIFHFLCLFDEVRAGASYRRVHNCLSVRWRHELIQPSKQKK